MSYTGQDKVVASAMALLALSGCKVETVPSRQRPEQHRTDVTPPRVATQASAQGEAFQEGMKQGLSSILGGGSAPPIETADARSGLAVDRPFPDNGTAQVFFDIVPDQELSEVTAYNRSQDNMILTWFYNFGNGDKEAARLYLRAGQSGRMTLPTYEYRLAAYTAPSNLGLDRGFGSNAKQRDFGFVDMRAPSRLLQERASFIYSGYGMGRFNPGKAAQ